MTPYQKLIAVFGSQAEIARQLNVTRSCVNKWFMRKRIPPEHVIPIERLAKHQVTRFEIRPDLYPTERVA